jgi:plasmid maintenance system antidote protein VapI
MKKEHHLPDEYVQIPYLEICSNKLIDSQSLIMIDAIIPLLIGKGKSPKVWLNIKNQENQWVEIIKNNISNNKQVKIEIDPLENKTIIKVNNLIILNAKMTNPENCSVKQLDLRAVGLNIYGDENGLMIGENKFSGNTIQGAKSLIMLSE